MLSGRGLPGPVVTLCVHGQGSSPCPAAARMGLWLLLAIPSFWGSSSQGSVQPGGGGGGAGQFWPGAPGLPVASGCFSCTAGGPSAMEACWLRASAPFHVCAIGLFVSHGNSQTMSR